jgi:hypothetical protein
MHAASFHLKGDSPSRQVRIKAEAAKQGRQCGAGSESPGSLPVRLGLGA